MTRFYSIDDANDRIDEVRDLLERLKAQRSELVELRDLGRRAAERRPVRTSRRGRRPGGRRARPELRAIRLRMQGLVDQMQASVGRLDEWDIVLRDIQTGLIDFPALVSGRQVWLCWRLGEGPVEWWHELETGFSSRQHLVDLS